MHILLSIKPQEVAEVSDDKYETELTKMADSATEKGVNEISAGETNLDSEVTKDEHGVSKSAERRPVAATGKNTNRNAKRNQARKSKKKARQNKKKGRH